jgi:hypothetical protein
VTPRIGREFRPDVSVIVPLKDEAPSLATLFERVRAVLEGMGRSFEVVFVDDGSTDRSPEVLTAMMRRDDRVRVIRLRKNFGKAAALAAGFAEFRGRAVITMDADLQDDPQEIPNLLAGLAAGYDVVSGWKVNRQDPWFRKATSRLFNWATRKLSGLPLHDFDCGLKAYTDQCARELATRSYGEMHRFLPVLAHARGFTVTEIPVNHFPRPHGSSRYGWERYVRALLDLITSTFLARHAKRPLHALGTPALLLLGLGGAVLASTLALSAVWGIHMGGWSVVTGAVLCLAGVQLIATGLVGELTVSHQEAEVPYSRIVALPEAERSMEELATQPAAAWGEGS